MKTKVVFVERNRSTYQIHHPLIGDISFGHHYFFLWSSGDAYPIVWDGRIFLVDGGDLMMISVVWELRILWSAFCCFCRFCRWNGDIPIFYT